MFKKGDQVIAVKASTHGNWEIGYTDFVHSTIRKMIWLKNLNCAAWNDFFILKKEHDFNNNMKDLLK